MWALMMKGTPSDFVELRRILTLSLVLPFDHLDLGMRARKVFDEVDAGIVLFRLPIDKHMPQLRV